MNNLKLFPPIVPKGSDENVKPKIKMREDILK
jgi:hypothetical protein